MAFFVDGIADIAGIAVIARHLKPGPLPLIPRIFH
jgi:hypothetical protein